MWLKIDDGFGEHSKILGLSRSARGTLIMALSYAARNETDGLLTAAIARHIGAKTREVNELVAAGLWHPTTGLPAACLRCAEGWGERLDGERLAPGWVIHDFLDYNPSHAQLEQKRQEARERMSKIRTPATSAPTAAPTEPFDIESSRRVRANN